VARAILRGVTWRSVTLILAESLFIVAAVALAVYLRLGARAWWELYAEEHLVGKSLLVAGVCQLCLYYADLYDLRSVTDARDIIVRVLQALGASSLLLGLLYYWFPELIIGRGVFMISAVIVLCLVVGWRLAFDWLTRRVGPRERLLIIGTSGAAVNLARELIERKSLGIEVAGFIDPDPARVGTPLLNPGIIGTIENVPAIVRSRAVDRVVVSLADARGKLPMQKLLEMKLEGVSFDHLASLYEEYTGKIAVENLRPSWLIFSSGFRKSAWLTASKRAFDVAASLTGLVGGAPVMLAIALLVKVTSRGPALYAQRRVGQHGREFTIHKFRSMRHDAEVGTGAVWASPNDGRVTRLGRLLRRTRLDELPQLWNILRGEMSFVGPRPERPEFVRELTEQIPFYGQRHVVKPGLTGWAQVSYSYGASVEDALEKLQYDLFYIKHLSLSFDLFIILSTIKIVTLQRGAS
jgi:sugar transferase (PEP-CTERM system associated)